MNYLYEQSKRLIELQVLYKELCYEYYKKTKSAITEEEQISRTKMNK